MQTKVLSSESVFKIIFSKFSTKVLFFMFVSLLVGIFMLYVYLVNKTVMNVVARENTEKQIAAISGTVGQMEFDYMNLKSGITLNVAYAHGFEDAIALKFLNNSKSSQLSYNYH